MRRLFFVLMMLAYGVSLTVAQETRSVIVPDNGQEVTEVGLFSVTEALNDAAFSPDSRFVALVGDDTALRVMNVATGEIVSESFEHFSFVQSVAWVSDMLITGSWDRTAIIWDVNDDGIPTVRETVSGYDAVVDVIEAPSAQEVEAFFMGWGDGNVRLYNAVSKQVSAEMSLSSLRVTSVAVSPDARSAVISGGYPSTGAQLWDVASLPFTPLGDIPYEGTVLASEYITNTLVALGGDDGTVMLWDTDGTQVASLDQSEWVVDLAVSPNFSILAVARQDGVLTLWDITTPEQSELIVAIVASDSAALTSVNFSPDGKLILTTDDEGAARLWGVEVK